MNCAHVVSDHRDSNSLHTCTANKTSFSSSGYACTQVAAALAGNVTIPPELRESTEHVKRADFVRETAQLLEGAQTRQASSEAIVREREVWLPVRTPLTHATCCWHTHVCWLSSFEFVNVSLNVLLSLR